MELLRGETLSDRLARSPVKLEEALRILRDVARGLAAAHKVGVVHRDLKPRNVYLHTEADTSTPTVKLVEFGISRIDTEETLTLSGVTLGSTTYVAPEQIEGRSVDKRADIWAFGALAYELFTGAPLFDGDTPAETVQKVTAGKIPELPRVAHEVDLDLRALVAGCLVRDPDRRVQSIEECGVIIDRVIKRVGHPTMLAVAELVPIRAAREEDEEEPTTVARLRGPSTERMGMSPLAPSEVEDALANLGEGRSFLDPDTITDISVTEGTPIDPRGSLSDALTERVAATDVAAAVSGSKSHSTSNGFAKSAAKPLESEPPPSGPRSVGPSGIAPSSIAPSSVDAPKTLVDPSSLARMGSTSEPPARLSSVPPRAASQPPPYDAGSLSTRAVDMFRGAGPDEKEAATTLAKRKRVSMIALAVVAAVVGSIGLAMVSRSLSSSSTRGASPNATSTAASNPTSVAASTGPSEEPAHAPTNEVAATSTPAPTVDVAPSSLPSASASPSASAKTKRVPAPVVSHPHKPSPGPTPSDGANGVFNPTSL
jgi:serine/threonine protein kinase